MHAFIFDIYLAPQPETESSSVSIWAVPICWPVPLEFLPLAWYVVLFLRYFRYTTISSSTAKPDILDSTSIFHRSRRRVPGSLTWSHYRSTIRKVGASASRYFSHSGAQPCGIYIYIYLAAGSEIRKGRGAEDTAQQILWRLFVESTRLDHHRSNAIYWLFIDFHSNYSQLWYGVDHGP